METLRLLLQQTLQNALGCVCPAGWGYFRTHNYRFCRVVARTWHLAEEGLGQVSRVPVSPIPASQAVLGSGWTRPSCQSPQHIHQPKSPSSQPHLDFFEPYSLLTPSLLRFSTLSGIFFFFFNSRPPSS